MIFSRLTELIKLILIGFLALTSFSCSEFLKGKPQKKDVIEVKKETLSCIKKVPDQFKIFLKSEATEAQIDNVFTCLDQTLSEFQAHVEGAAEASAFTTDELFQIFNKFIHDDSISKLAIEDLLNLKAALLGGSSQKITKNEIADLRKFLKLIQVEAKALSPYAKIFKLQKEQTIYSQKLLQDGFSQLNLSLKNLFVASKINRSDYQFTDLKKLMQNLKLIDQEQSEFWFLAEKLKDLLIGQMNLTSESDYMTVIDNLTEVLRLYSLQVQDYIHFELKNPTQVNDAIDYASAWIDLLENTLQYKKSKIISIETIDPFLKVIISKKLIPIDVKEETFISFYKTLFVHVFQPNQAAEVSAFSGLSRIHFATIKREVAILKIYLDAISVVPVDQRLPIAQIQTQLKSYDPLTRSHFLKNLEVGSRLEVLNAFEDLKSEFLTSRPIVYRANKVVIASNQEIWDQNWSDMARAVYIKILSRELLIGWGNGQQNPRLTAASISENQLVQWYSDFKQFGIEVKSFDPRSVNSGALSFKQANLLTYVADGDDKMNFLETIQYLNILLSGGGQTLAELQNGFEVAQCQLPEIDAFGNPWLNEVCMMTDLRKNYKSYFSNLPYLTAYMSQLDHKEFFKFYLSMMEITRLDPKLAGQKVETGDLRMMAILFHFIESLYVTYDVNRNGTLSAAEIRAAYPRFKNFAKKYAYDNAKEQIDDFNGFLAKAAGYYCYSEEDLIRESFIFLVFNGKAPERSDLNNAPCLFGNSLIDLPGEVNRMKILNTFKILKAVLGSS